MGTDGSTNVCNCDANLPILDSDNGEITSMDSLPITGVFYGPLEYTLQNARFTIGRLQCKGNSVKDSDPSTSCAAMKKAGNFQSGIYSFQTPGDKWPHLSHCDMMNSNGYNDNTIESLKGYINIEPKKEKIMFSVYSSTGNVNGGYLDFDHSWVDNGFPLSNGEFLAPVKGNYEFNFNGHTYHSCSYRVGVQVLLNGSEIHSFYEYDNESENFNHMVSSSLIVSLNVGDSIRLYVEQGCLATDSYRYRSFTGKLIEIL